MSDNKKIATEFDAFFSTRGYTQLESVNITSKIDKTVYLVNSATNLFKQYFDYSKCIFTRQQCMRTQNLLDFYDERTETQYPTCFESYGAYVPISEIQKLFNDTIDFFATVGFKLKDMRIRASSKDALLLKTISCSQLRDKLILDRRDEKYDHKYGSGLIGRTIKVDYYNESQKKHKNLCYLILIICNGVQVGVELATSNQLILMRLMDFKYGIQVEQIADILPTASFAQRRFADSIAGVFNLICEGVKPNSSNTNGRTLKKYIYALKYFAEVLAIPIESIPEVLIEYNKIKCKNKNVNSSELFFSIFSK